LKCHAIGGVGGQVGPDLSSIGASAQIDYLIESLLEPSKAIKENYHSLLVSTRRGKQYTGIKVRQTTTSLILRTNQDQEVAISLKDIEEQTPSKTSLMPEGLTDTLTHAELVDLTRFLSELGKGSYTVGKARLVRRWEALDATPAALAALRKESVTAAVGNQSLPWSPIYTTVAGFLPLADSPLLTIKEDARVAILRTQMEATAAAKMRLKWNNSRGLTLWLDGKPLKIEDGKAINLTVGSHTLVVVIDRLTRKEPLRCEMDDEATTAAVRFVGGK
jgi:putative heme-binding domain-containing protein